MPEDSSKPSRKDLLRDLAESLTLIDAWIHLAISGIPENEPARQTLCDLRRTVRRLIERVREMDS